MAACGGSGCERGGVRQVEGDGAGGSTRPGAAATAASAVQIACCLSCVEQGPPQPAAHHCPCATHAPHGRGSCRAGGWLAWPPSLQSQGREGGWMRAAGHRPGCATAGGGGGGKGGRRQTEVGALAATAAASRRAGPDPRTPADCLGAHLRAVLLAPGAVPTVDGRRPLSSCLGTSGANVGSEGGELAAAADEFGGSTCMMWASCAAPPCGRYAASCRRTQPCPCCRMWGRPGHLAQRATVLGLNWDLPVSCGPLTCIGPLDCCCLQVPDLTADKLMCPRP